MGALSNPTHALPLILMIRRISSISFYLAGLLLFFVFGQAMIEFFTRNHAAGKAPFSAIAAVGIVAGTVVLAIVLVLLARWVVMRLFFPHLLIEEPFGEGAIERIRAELARDHLVNEPAMLPSDETILSHMESKDEYWEEQSEGLLAGLKEEKAADIRGRVRSAPHAQAICDAHQSKDGGVAVLDRSAD